MRETLPESQHEPLPGLDPLLHQPVRTRLVIALLGEKELSFTDLKAVLGVTDGNLDAHMKKLTEKGFIHTRMVSEGRPRTLYSLSSSGKKAVTSYLKNVKDLLKGL